MRMRRVSVSWPEPVSEKQQVPEAGWSNVASLAIVAVFTDRPPRDEWPATESLHARYPTPMVPFPWAWCNAAHPRPG